MRRPKILMITVVVSFNHIDTKVKTMDFKKVDKEDGFHDGLDRYLGNIKIKKFSFSKQKRPKSLFGAGKENGIDFFCHH
jgi:hypothetical protein